MKTDKIIKWIKEQVNEANSKGTVIGLSGGLDSSVTAALCKKAFPENTLGLIMPCFSSQEDVRHAKLIAKKFNISTKEVDLCVAFENLIHEFEGEDYNKDETNLAIANIKPRLRMLTLYYFANKLDYLVVGSGNKSEIMAGYFTKYGDGGCDIMPLGDLLKTQVRELAKDLGIPKEIIEKPPSAGLWKGQTDEEELGIGYEELDEILSKIEKNKLESCEPKMLKKVQSTIKKSEHKRRMPKICKI